jgi:predicted short-subunit dehydrogenase-like oxidoreductase (DUF2520 family)
MRLFEKTNTSIGFVGAGLLGNGLGKAISKKGYQVTSVASQNFSSAKQFARRIEGCTPYKSIEEVSKISDLIFITAPDDSIEAIASNLQGSKGKAVIHCSGVLSTKELQKTRDEGAYVGCFHPLQTFPSVKVAVKNMVNTTFSIEASKPLRKFLEKMTKDLGGHYIYLKSDEKILYHAAATITSGYTVTLLKLALDLWYQFDFSRDKALKALLPLLKGTITGIESVGISKALTGPISRGDILTITKHLHAINKTAPSILPAYCQIGLNQIPLALEKGTLSSDIANEIQSLLEKTLESTIIGV